MTIFFVTLKTVLFDPIIPSLRADNRRFQPSTANGSVAAASADAEAGQQDHFEQQQSGGREQDGGAGTGVVLMLNQSELESKYSYSDD